jgi:mono/diheme cytochrome c family protein
MTRVLGRALVSLLAVAGGVALLGGAWFFAHGISARPEPSALEATVANRLRALAIPSAAVARTAPADAREAPLADAFAHYADHCAACHAADGSGQTEMGRGLYPRPPDLKLPATQSLTDGTLFYIIENGVKLTGMPAWSTGTSEGEAASWQLVRVIRRLPALTEAERQQIEALMPKSAREWHEAEEERKFLEGH